MRRMLFVCLAFFVVCCDDIVRVTFAAVQVNLDPVLSFVHISTEFAARFWFVGVSDRCACCASFFGDGLLDLSR